MASASADNTCRIVSLPVQFGTGVSINPLHTLLLACVVAAILVWILNFIDLQPFYNLDDGKDIIEVSDATAKAIMPQTTSSVYKPSSSIDSIIESIATEAPVIQVVSQEPVVVIEKEEKASIKVEKPNVIHKSKTIHAETSNNNRDEL